MENYRFFDIDISRSGSKFATSVYRKITFTGLFTNFNSFIPRTYKKDIVSHLIPSIFTLAPPMHLKTFIHVHTLRLSGMAFPLLCSNALIIRRFLGHTFDSQPPDLTRLRYLSISYFINITWRLPH